MKEYQSLAIFVDTENENISMLVLPEEDLSQARVFTQKIIGNIKCESGFNKNLYSLLKTANLNSCCSYKIKLIMPDDFFNYETIKLKNNLKNNFFAKKQICNYIINCKDYLINFTKFLVNKEYVFYNVCYVKKWIVKSIKKLEKTKNIKLEIICSKIEAQIAFLNKYSLYKNNKFIFAEISENKSNLTLIENNKKVKLITLKNKENNTENNFLSLCKSLMLKDVFCSFKNSFYKNEQQNYIKTLINYINVLAGFEPINVVVLENGSNEILSKLINANVVNKYINFINTLNEYKIINQIELVGVNSIREFNNNIFTFSIFNKISCKFKNILISFKLWFKNFVGKFKPRKKLINIKEE